jgi:aminoglycoside 2'-N-acetyltransferase I
VTLRIRQLGTKTLSSGDVDRVLAIMVGAFGDDPEERFTDADWEHALGGRHFLVDDDGTILGHASVVPRELQVAGRSLRTGYVEAVAIDPARHGRGLGSRLMEDVNGYVTSHFELGALGTERHAFYERLPTPDEDGYILVLPTPATPLVPLDLTLPLGCDWRPGDVW